MEIPYINGDYKILFQPQKYGNYVNDHCIIKGNGSYHLFGITSFTSSPPDERMFVHGVGNSLSAPFNEVGVSINTGTLAWSPCVIEKDDHYYIYYGPSPSKMAVSPDFYEWFGYPITIENEPPMAMHRDHFVMQIGDRYYMYASGIKDKKGCLSVASSFDLLHWKFEGYALTSDDKAPLKPAWGAFESPFIVKRDDYYYLFITYTDCNDANYNDTFVFASKDPLNFGCYMGDKNPAQLVTKLYAHAPEILQEDGQYYITTCGWLNAPTPNKGCVSIAPLSWKSL